MRKRVCMFLIVLALIPLAACTGKNGTTASNASKKVDVDLTDLSETMVYSEVYNMTVKPEDYTRKTVKIKGKFAYYKNPNTKKEYFACIVSDATACCTQGLEFILDGTHRYPDDYPKVDSEITVVGTFDSYEEDKCRYCRLLNASIVS